MRCIEKGKGWGGVWITALTLSSRSRTTIAAHASCCSGRAQKERGGLKRGLLRGLSDGGVTEGINGGSRGPGVTVRADPHQPFNETTTIIILIHFTIN